MAVVYVDQDKYKIFQKKPRYGMWVDETKHTKSFTYTTNNPNYLRGIVAKKGNQLRYWDNSWNNKPTSRVMQRG